MSPLLSADERDRQTRGEDLTAFLPDSPVHHVRQDIRKQACQMHTSVEQKIEWDRPAIHNFPRRLITFELGITSAHFGLI